MRERFIELCLPIEVVNRELAKYNAREEHLCNPTGNTWPSTRFSAHKKINYAAQIKFIVKFKRRERWEKLKARLGPEYLERIRLSALQDTREARESFHQYERHPSTLAVLA